ncbi:hypothetical protein ACFLWS_05155 [Chloroflexota bacterium]
MSSATYPAPSLKRFLEERRGEYKESQREASPLLKTSPPLLLKERGIKGVRLIRIIVKEVSGYED